MVSLENAVTARFDSKGEKFEILVDPDLALELRKGNEVNFSDLLAVETVFKDAAKGTEQSPEQLSKAFGTTEVQQVARKIIKDGDVQLTTDQRRQMRSARIREVVDFIARNAMNPQTNAPHPPKRIEQIQGIVKELRKVIPISLEHIQIAVKINSSHAARAEHVLHKYKISKEQWLGDGSLIAVVDMPAGLKQDFLNDLNGVCHGNVETKILEK